MGDKRFGDEGAAESLSFACYDFRQYLRRIVLRSKHTAFCRIYEDAKDFFTSAIDHNNKVGQFYVHRARALYMMEEVEEARRDILVALHLDPDNDEVGRSK